MGEGTFYKLGRLAGGKYLEAKWVWDSLAGDPDEAIRAEWRVGRTMAESVRQQTSCNLDSEMLGRLRALQTRLAARVSNPLHRFEVNLTEEPQPTAFALPGGFIFVARSLVELCDAIDDEVGFVIAHEMSHVIRRHAIDRLLGQKVMSAAARATPARGAVTAWIRQVGVTWLERAYSQEQEFEADELGGLLMRAAGFDPTGAVRALRRLQAVQGVADETGIGVYLSTHPPVDERIARLCARLTLDA